MTSEKKRHSPLFLAVLAGGALFFAWSRSRDGRGTVDYVVLGLLVAAVLYNLVRFVHSLTKPHLENDSHTE